MFDTLKKMFEKNAKIISVKAAEDGRTIPMDQVNDQTFAQELWDLESQSIHQMGKLFLQLMERSPQ